MVCLHCGLEVRFDPQRGWHHILGGRPGGLIVMRCKDCKYQSPEYPYPKVCPNCGSGNWEDQHVVNPVKSARKGDESENTG